MEKPRKCNYEIAPYTGTGIDPPVCGASATRGFRQEAYCERHAMLGLAQARASRAKTVLELAEADKRIAALENPTGLPLNEIAKRAWEKRKILLPGLQAYENEATVLSASPTACAAADAWWEAIDDFPPTVDDKVMPTLLVRALNDLEAATRESPLRKVKP